MKNKKIVISLIIILLAITSILIVILNNKSEKIDNTSLNYNELKEFLVQKGYYFKKENLFNYDIVYCSNNSIGFLATFDKETHQVQYMNYENSNINSKNCNIWNSSKNTSEESKKLYSDYLEWLEKNGLKDVQVIDLLYNYYLEL